MYKRLNFHPFKRYNRAAARWRHGFIEKSNDNKMVEVFKTNVQEDKQSQMLIEKLSYHFPHCRINFDLEDCDNILRIQGDDFSIEIITSLLQSDGYKCEALI